MAEIKTVGIEVLELLGMKTDKCLGFTVKFAPNDIITVDATYVVEADDAERVVRMLKLRNG
jgi:hypothetical protein